MKNLIKGFVLGVVVCSLITAFATIASNNVEMRTMTAEFCGIQIDIDNTPFVPKDAAGKEIEPFIVDGTTFLPVRAIAEAFNKEVSWNGSLKKISISEKSELASDLSFADLEGLEFWFGSGAGAWSTIVTILPDGSFNGYYHDSEAGSYGDDYPNGTLYECYFNGKFSPIKKIGDYEYSMKCESIQTESTPGEEKITDGVKLITSEPYGFDNADEFFLYLPGKKTSELSEEFLSWFHGAGDDGVLNCYGLYNVGGGQGFIVWSE